MAYGGEETRLPMREDAPPPADSSILRSAGPSIDNADNADNATDAATDETDEQLPSELALAMRTGDVSSFVGRDNLVATAVALLHDPKRRLMNLRGTGGVGKTRVVGRVVTEVRTAELFRDGVYFVSMFDLPADSGDNAIASAIGHALGIPANVDKPLRRLFELLRGKKLLLVLDNCEHLAWAGTLARLLTMLLRASADLQVLATSRADLEVEGEHVLDVPPLCVGDQQAECDCAVSAPLDEPESDPREQLLPRQRPPVVHTAVQLLRDRADAVGVTIGDAELPLAERLCRLEGGIPLGIELSARFLRTAPLQVLVDNRRRHQPGRGIRGGQSNQDGMTPTLRWTASYLPTELRQAWAIVSVFEGGSFDLEAATAVLNKVGATETHTALTLLDELIGQSILIGHPDHPTGIPRYEMLPPLMEFGRLLLDGTELPGATGERDQPAPHEHDKADQEEHLHDHARNSLDESIAGLAHSDEPASTQEARRLARTLAVRVHDAHADYFEALVARCAADWFSKDEALLLARIAADGPNVDAAIRWLLAAEHKATPADAACFTARGEQMAINDVRSRAPIHHGFMFKARNRLARSVADGADAPTPLHVVALALQAWLATIQGEAAEAEQLLARADTIAAHLSAAAPAGSSATPPWPLLHARATWLWINRSDDEDIAEAMRLYDLAAGEAELGHGGDAYMVHLFRAMCAAFYLSEEVARQYVEEILRDAENAGATWSISWALWVSALIGLRHDPNPYRALELAQSALDMQAAIADTWGPVWSLWLIALCLMKLRRYERAAQVFGGAQAAQHLSQGDVHGLPTFLRLQQHYEAIASQALGEDTFNAYVSYWRELGLGGRKDIEEIRDLARRSVLRTDSPEIPGGLTVREWEVVLLATEGLTYQQIGNRLGISGRSIEHIMSSAKTKLKVDHRRDVFQWVRDHHSAQMTSR